MAGEAQRGSPGLVDLPDVCGKILAAGEDPAAVRAEAGLDVEGAREHAVAGKRLQRLGLRRGWPPAVVDVQAVVGRADQEPRARVVQRQRRYPWAVAKREVSLGSLRGGVGGSG